MISDFQIYGLRYFSRFRWAGLGYTVYVVGFEIQAPPASAGRRPLRRAAGGVGNVQVL